MTAAALLEEIRVTALQAGPYDELSMTEKGCIAIYPSTPPSTWSVRASLSSLVQRMCLGSQEPSGIDLDDRVENLSPILSTLQQIFGSKRLERNLAFINRYCRQDSQIQKTLSPEKYETLLHCLFLTTKEDHEELLSEIQSASTSVRGLTQEALEKVRQQFAGKTIETCSKDDIECLESILLPFARLNNLFLKDASHTQTDVHAPTTFAAMIEKAAWGKYLLQTRSWAEEEWEYIFGKVFSPPLLPEHLILPHKQGYSYLSHLVEGGGASFRLFSPLGTSSIDPFILARSTRGLMPTDGLMETVQSLADNFRKKPGSYGCVATSKRINDLLTDPKLGFVKTPDQNVHIIGYSQGGVHAQYLAVLYAPRVKKLTTIASLAPHPELGDLFRKTMAKLKTPMTLLHMIDVGDIVPLTGGELLWAEHNVELTVKLFAPVLEPVDDFSRKSVWQIAWDITHLPQTIDKFSQAHSRLTVADSYKVQTLTMASQEALLFCQHNPRVIDPSWEAARQLVCFLPSYDCPDVVANQGN